MYNTRVNNNENNFKRRIQHPYLDQTVGGNT